MRRVLIVYAHPLALSYCGRLCDALAENSRLIGHEVRITDLYKIGFDPRLTQDELGLYFSEVAPEDNRRSHIDDLKWCDFLIFIYPTWWYGMPAIMKGYIDRIFVPRVALLLDEKEFIITGLLDNIKTFVIVTTHGSPWWWIHLRMGNPGKKAVVRAIAPLIARDAKVRWLAAYNMDRLSAVSKLRFGRRVEKAMYRLLSCLS